MYQIFPSLSDDQFKALKTSIEQRGVEIPVIIDQKGKIIDGYHRSRACQELGIDCPKEVRKFHSEQEKLELALLLNCQRRHLNTKQKAEVVKEYLKLDPELSSNAIAEITGVSDKTVAKIRCALESTSEIPKLSKFRGKDGKRRKRAITTNTKRETEKALKIINDLKTKNKVVDITTASRSVRRHAKQSKRKVPPIKSGKIKIFHCAFQELEEIAKIKPGTIDLIMTDIPYEKTFLPEITELGQVTSRILKEGGIFATYYGHYHLDQVMAELGNHLTYRWICSTHREINGNKMHPLQVVSRWKPVLIYSKGKWSKRKDYWSDIKTDSNKEKNLHIDQQPVEEFEFWIDQLSNPGDLIVDLCAGSFSTAVASKNLKRKYIGCDSNGEAVKIGKKRLK